MRDKPRNEALQKMSLPDHVADTVSELAELHAAHQDTAGPTEKLIRSTTKSVGRPLFLGIFLGLIGMWIFGNAFASRSDMAIDEPPFVYLELACTVLGVCLTILILVTQQRDDALAQRREQMTLQLAAIGDRKSAKVISLLEELRRDLPGVADRHDREASQMATPESPKEVLKAIRDSHGQTDTGVDEPELDD
jgi:uncharacterized membrane protein